MLTANKQEPGTHKGMPSEVEAPWTVTNKGNSPQSCSYRSRRNSQTFCGYWKPLGTYCGYWSHWVNVSSCISSTKASFMGLWRKGNCSAYQGQKAGHPWVGTWQGSPTCPFSRVWQGVHMHEWKRRSEFLAVTCMWPCILSLFHVKLEEKLCWGRARARHRRWSCRGDDNIPSFESSTGLKHTKSYGFSIPSDVWGTCNYLGRYHVHQLHFGGLQNQDNWGLL